MEIILDKITSIHNITIEHALQFIEETTMYTYETSFYKNNHDNKIHLVLTDLKRVD